tara:strand:+ start:1600 stop:1743 length:144 start_codon:yes stop_codon:yes gene_type:complete
MNPIDKIIKQRKSKIRKKVEAIKVELNELLDMQKQLEYFKRLRLERD